MAFGYEVDLNSLDAGTIQGSLVFAYPGICLALLGLLIRVSLAKPPSWYPLLEHFLAFGFVSNAIVLALALPLSWTAAKIYFGFYFFEILLYLVLPGRSHEGLPVKELKGKTRQYKCNGLLAFILTIAVYFYGGIYGQWWELTLIYDNFTAILNTVNLWTIFLSIVLYVKGKVSPTIMTSSTGRLIYDLWDGVELNPELFGFDIKYWSKFRPSLIGWVLIDLSLAASQYKTYGTLSLPMMLVCSFHFLYVADNFFFENYNATTWDVTYEKFGFMLSWGDNVWIPFFYSSPVWLVLEYTEISNSYAALCCLVYIVGHIIFRGTNRQKHHFKAWIKNGQKSSKGEKMGGGYFFNTRPKMLKDKNGRFLLVSGWWGLARHMNYTGDLLVTLAYGLPVGLRHGILPYIHLIFLLGLLLHRFARDDQACAAKYSKEWQEYRRIVPYKLIPKIF